jgi:hypothetical protein
MITMIGPRIPMIPNAANPTSPATSAPIPHTAAPGIFPAACGAGRVSVGVAGAAPRGGVVDVWRGLLGERGVAVGAVTTCPAC